MPDFELQVEQDAEPFSPDPVTVENLYVEITDPYGVVITDLPRRSNVSFTEPLNSTGSGELAVHLDDEILVAYPNLLKVDNIVRFWLADDCVSGFRIKSRGLTIVSREERAALAMQISGPTVFHLFYDFHVKHWRTPRFDSPDTRAFNWTSPEGEWYNPNNWVLGAFNTWSLSNPPTRRKRYQPVDWLVPSARWCSAGRKFYRRQFSISTQTTVRIFATADEWYKCFLDGDLILEGTEIEVGYQSFEYIDIVLPPGPHVIAFSTTGIGTPGGDGNDSLLFAMCSVDKNGDRVLPPILVSDSSWRSSIHKPPIGWNRACVLRQVVSEAQARGSRAAQMLSFDFTHLVDSSGQPWTDSFNEEVGIGSSILDLTSSLTEGNGFDVWVDPEDFSIKAWKKRGIDKSASIALIPGVNLLDYSVEETDDVVNHLLIQYDGGFTEVNNMASQAKYGRREGYLSLGGVGTKAGAERVGLDILLGLGEEHKEAGTADYKSSTEEKPSGSITAVEGMIPMVDWGVGDIITSLDINFQRKRQRVLSLTCQEDNDGNLTWDAELEEVTQYG